MLFNSFQYLLFLPVVFFLYWIINKKSLLLQNTLLLIASYYFYSRWDWRFLFLLIFSTLLDYSTGLKIYSASSKKAKKTWLFISVFINLGFLCFFKYFNFFTDTFTRLVKPMDFQPDFVTLNIVLPVGISFYTFHGLSYVFDIYNGKIKPTKNWIEYSLFVSFFPLLVAGPIERATHLLPQMETPRVFNHRQAVDGLKQMLWGFFKKVVIADNCAKYANDIFNHYHAYSGSTLIVGALLFTFQIYGDFSGYSDIALGTARLFGFELIRNFAYPYFSRDIAEFWRRWHISLSSWFRDYLYIPLGGSKGGLWMRLRNTFIIFLVSGFWHGANWTFIVWGALNALFIMPSIIINRNKHNIETVALGKLLPSIKEALHIIITFSITVIAWIFFRSDSVSNAVMYIRKIFSSSLLTMPQILPAGIFILVIFFFVIEWLGRANKYAIEEIAVRYPLIVRWGFYSFLLFLIGMYMQTEETAFIYFQF